MPSMKSPFGLSVPSLLFLMALSWGGHAAAQNSPAGDPAQGKTFFGQNCALCHAAAAGVTQQGPSLAGVVGRRAGSVAGFNYSKALSGSGLTWDAPTLDRFLTDPGATVPGTTMAVPIPVKQDRDNVIAYFQSLASASK